MLAPQTVRYGLILIVVGLGGYFLSGMPSVTALIPAAFGVPILVCGFVARDERWRKHAMHVAAVLSLVAILGTIRGLFKLPLLIFGENVARPGAVVSQSITALVSIWYFRLCVQSFLEARRRR